MSIILAIALVPTVIHSYLGAKTDDGRITSAIGATLAGLTSKPTERRGAWVKDIYDSEDWIERRYLGPNGEDVLLFVARSYDLKRLYHHPELGVLRGNDFTRPQPAKLAGAPVHVLQSQSGSGVALYGLLYERRFIENPISFQLKSSWWLLFSPRKPMTLFLAYDRHSQSTAPLDRSAAARVLTAAIKSFLSQTSNAPS